MSKPLTMDKTEFLRWLRAFCAYLFGSSMVGIGLILENLHLGLWTYLLIAVGGALADFGRRFIADTQIHLTETKVTTTVTSTDPPPSEDLKNAP